MREDPSELVTIIQNRTGDTTEWGNEMKLKMVAVALMLLVSAFTMIFAGTTPARMDYFGDTGGIIYGDETRISECDASILSFHDENTGQAFTSHGDVNGDGIDDLVIGTPNATMKGEVRGRVDIFFGGTQRWSMDMGMDDADVSIYGNEKYESLGSIIRCGDINDDGIDDIILKSGYAVKSFRIFFGRGNWSSTYFSNRSDSHITVEYPSQYFTSIVAGNDVNGDGAVDIVIGSYNYGDLTWPFRGKLYFLFGGSHWDLIKNGTFDDHANATILGENSNSRLGQGLANLGDVNGDGFDDITCTGVTPSFGWGNRHMILGRENGWKKEMKIEEEVKTSFHNTYDITIQSFFGLGDIDQDGYGDMAFRLRSGESPPYNYMIEIGYGQSDPFGTNISYRSIPRRSTIKEEQQGISFSTGIGCNGDIDGDGIDDMLFGSTNFDPHTYEIGKGKIYVHLLDGKELPSMATVSDCDASYVSAPGRRNVGSAMKMNGDLNDDGYDDIVVRSFYISPSAPPRIRKLHIIFGGMNFEPRTIDSLLVSRSSDFTKVITRIDPEEIIFVKAIGEDRYEDSNGKTRVKVTNQKYSDSLVLELPETGANTGEHLGSFRISSFTNETQRVIRGKVGDQIQVVSLKDSNRFRDIVVDGPLLLMPIGPDSYLMEGEDYLVDFWNWGYADIVNWDYESDADWLTWDEEKTDLYGTPGNGDVGQWEVKVTATDEFDDQDIRHYTLMVVNIDPDILNSPVTTAYQNSHYEFDLNSDVEGQGSAYCERHTDALWISINSETGVINGTPTNDDIGNHSMTAVIDDANGARTSIEFVITVFNINDPPMILTADVKRANEDEKYFVDYDAVEIDTKDSYHWEFDSDAYWLDMDLNTGILSGTPTNDDVGFHAVNIKAVDTKGDFEERQFNIEVININDVPFFSTAPNNALIGHNMEYTFDVDASDVDIGDEVKYSISSYPLSDIAIDRDTGVISWTASLEPFEELPYKLYVEIAATDGELTAYHDVILEVLPNPAPTTSLHIPSDGKRVTSEGITLTWSGVDPNGDCLCYTLYLSCDLKDVTELNDECCLLESTNRTSYTITGLDCGKTYFWTVIPCDGCSLGVCIDGFMKFYVNTPPEFLPMPGQTAIVRERFVYQPQWTDGDEGDMTTISLISGPDGMVINEGTGTIIWEPREDQEGDNLVKLSISDGLESREEQFQITVSGIISENTDKGIPVVAMVIPTAILILIVIFIAALLIIRNRRSDKENEKDDQVPDQSEQGKKEEPTGGNGYSSIATSLEEAHSADHIHHDYSYEDLYGMKAPQQVDELTTGELKEYIGKTINALENGNMEELLAEE